MQSLIKELNKLKDSVRAEHSQRFFKTGKGEYGEGDVFIGLTMPQLRKVASNYQDLSINTLEQLLYSKIHEHRMIALLIAVLQYKKAIKQESKKAIYDFFIVHSKQINNWDLVDVTVPHVVGDYLLDKDRSILYKFAKSKNLWQRRIAVLACFAFIREKDFKDAIKISELLLQDKHDLIHKAVGWMLREIGKRDEKVLTKFLDKYCLQMPRTMLRYSIERLEETKRKDYLNKKAR
ncbi:DNA alkylation repair protein [Candidatus Falkowbacteria bacterium]|jgi:3-methyladenine DNA glycosylase AlkD|nr:DNA alkylation repair protein [Candidatus Falkowbacteria bacterium]MBT7007465.1 DNA alkylation repair protein [Candidatus Falkowbacteria bacterium]